MSQEKIELGVEQAESYLQNEVTRARSELKEHLSQLKHGQKERLLLAIAEYPQNEQDFSAEQVEMIKAYSALKICFDANVAYGVQMVIEQMRLERAQTEGENNG